MNPRTRRLRRRRRKYLRVCGKCFGPNCESWCPFYSRPRAR